MIIWINGAFGAGKSTTSELLLKHMPEAHLFDPEMIGYIIQKTFPAARSMDYQDLPMWRNLVVQFINESAAQFPSPIIIPMTLVVPEYLSEIFTGITDDEHKVCHFFLQTEKAELERRINNQKIFQSNPEKDEEVRQWRLDQIDRCYKATSLMPEETIFLDTNKHTPEDLVSQMIAFVDDL